jgi:hypothetical protein
MARLLELIREGTAPKSMVRRAARGELALSAGEAIEILVMLAGDRELGAEAEQTLAGWKEASLSEVASNPVTPPEVLRYLLRTQMHRSAVMTALCGNLSLSREELEAAASRGGVETLCGMLRSRRVRSSIPLLELMMQNPAAGPAEPELRRWLAEAEGIEAEQVVANLLVRHADEVAREDGKPFELAAGFEDEDDPLNELLTRAKRGEAVVEPEEKNQLTLLQRLGSMRVGERIKLAVRGNRGERMVLIRDRSKLVSLAVLASPKVNESEMETYAAMKNVQEAVLRAIASNRKNLKNYGVVKTLVNNPKTPLDVGLPLVSHLLLKDLRSLAVNKNLNETVRKQAMRLFVRKTERKTD